jgi:hypothetical protein
MTFSYIRAQVKRMPRTKHEHNFAVVVSDKGNRQRWGCISCPAVDPTWYRAFQSGNGNVPMNSDFTINEYNVDSDGNRVIEKIDLHSVVLGPGPSGELITDHLYDAGWPRDDSNGCIARPVLYGTVSLTDCGELEGAHAESEYFTTEGAKVLDAEHPHADVPDEGPADEIRIYTKDELSAMKLPDLKVIAAEFGIQRLSRMTKSTMIQEILNTQNALVNK